MFVKGWIQVLAPPIAYFTILFAGIAVIAFYHFQEDSTDDQSTEVKEQKAQTVKCQTRYKRLLKSKRVLIPIPIYNSNLCEDELKTCTESLTTIKHWCDPYCRQQLDDCLEALQTAREVSYDYYSREF